MSDPFGGVDLGSLLRTGASIGDAWNQGVQQRQAEQENQLKIAGQQRAAQREAARQAAVAAKVATGDYVGAAAAAATYGDAAGAKALTDVDTNHHTNTIAGTTGFANIAHDVVTRIPLTADGQGLAARRAQIQSMKPLLVQMGADPSVIDGIAANPTDEVLGSVSGVNYSMQQDKADHVAQQNADSTTRNAGTVEYTAHRPIVAAPGSTVLSPDGVPIYHDQTVVQTGPGVTTSIVPGFDGGTGGQPTGPASNNTVAARNNNPGNLKYDGHSKWQGMTGVDARGFVVFDTPANGDRALGINIQNQQRFHGINTLGQFFQKYAPAGDHNDPAAYAANVAKRLGVGVNDHIDFTNPAVVAALKPVITGVESGGIPPKFSATQSGQPNAGQPTPIRQPQVVQVGQPLPQRGAGGGAGGQGDTGSIGDHAALVRAIAEGRAAPPNARTVAGQKLLAEVTAYDPTFDAANATSRVRTRVDFTSGKTATARTALNTAIGHAIQLDDQARKLGNSSIAPGIINPLYNSLRTNVGNNTSLGAFEQSKQALASEMRKVFSGSGGTLQELEDWEKTLDASQSYEQLHVAIQNGVKLMGSRLGALRDQYGQGMGRSDMTPRFMTDANLKAAREHFGVTMDDGNQQYPTQGRPAPQQRSAPASQSAPSRDRSPPVIGQPVTRNGKTFVWTGSTWQAR